MENALVDFGKREKLAQCTCLDYSDSTVVFSDRPEDFRALMNIQLAGVPCKSFHALRTRLEEEAAAESCARCLALKKDHQEHHTVSLSENCEAVMKQTEAVQSNMNLKHRVARLSRKFSEMLERDRLGNCNCTDVFLASPLNPREFEEQMNRPCPTHGLRNLGAILHLQFIKALDGRPDTSAPKDPGEIELEHLIEIYYERLGKIGRIDHGTPND